MVFPKQNEDTVADAGEQSIAEAVRSGYKLDESDIELGFKIGQGNSGTVYEGLYMHQKVAVKQILTESFEAGALEAFRREVGVMKDLTHPNLVALLGVVDKLPKLLIVTELMEKGALWDLYHESPPLTVAEQHHAIGQPR